MSGDNDQSRVVRWTSVQVYVLSAVCLVIGLAVGYLIRGSAAPQAPANIASLAAKPAVTQTQVPAVTQAQAPPEMSAAQVTPEQLKKMADMKAAPLLDKLKQNPNNPETLAQVGGIYFAARQFGEATQYFEKSAKLKPTASLLTTLSSAYYFSGSGDKAIAALNQALQIDPKFANALYNLGMLKWQLRGDTQGALDAWGRLLKAYPNHPNRAQVEKMIARVKEHQTMPAGTKTEKPAS